MQQEQEDRRIARRCKERGSSTRKGTRCPEVSLKYALPMRAYIPLSRTITSLKHHVTLQNHRRLSSKYLHITTADVYEEAYYRIPRRYGAKWCDMDGYMSGCIHMINSSTNCSVSFRRSIRGISGSDSSCHRWSRHMVMVCEREQTNRW